MMDSPDTEHLRAQALAAELAEFELDDTDRELIAGGELSAEQSRAGWPVVAVIGRPNVGKST
ncbi:MAG: ribosome biogenesis GTPase Der, partial [Bowdeniella nasicola]|nr:ribosome biogenesis GTPase Der [Bowdeniella nasicola]